MQYTLKVMEHFQNPRNQGKITDADGVGKTYNPLDCGDTVKIYFKVKKEASDNRNLDIISEIKYEIFGCAAAIASSSIFSEMAQGKRIIEVLKISRQDVARALGGLPETKINCSTLAPDAFKKAVKNYFKKQKKGFFSLFK